MSSDHIVLLALIESFHLNDYTVNQCHKMEAYEIRTYSNQNNKVFENMKLRHKSQVATYQMGLCIRHFSANILINGDIFNISIKAKTINMNILF